MGMHFSLINNISYIYGKTSKWIIHHNTLFHRQRERKGRSGVWINASLCGLQASFALVAAFEITAKENESILPLPFFSIEKHRMATNVHL